MVKRVEDIQDNPECVPSVEDFRDAVWGIADKLSDVEGIKKKAASKALFDAIKKFEGAQ
ncbi:MAG: hypothetical protein WCD86_25735 [Ktedonobacteraceae bacterium]